MKKSFENSTINEILTSSRVSENVKKVITGFLSMLYSGNEGVFLTNLIILSFSRKDNLIKDDFWASGKQIENIGLVEKFKHAYLSSEVEESIDVV